MTCESYEEQISALIDHELRDDEATALFLHLGACPSCRRSLQSVLGLRSDLREEISPLAPVELDERILKQARLARRVSADRKAVRVHFWTGRISMPVPVAALLLVFLIAGSLMMSLKSTQSPLPVEGRVEAVYITTLPAVEVQGNFP
jgi:anti-sigma factor RsiW